MKEIYEENKILDELFEIKYGKNENEIYLKNHLALLVEIGELLNEVKCFKYWSIKKADKTKIKEEYADVLMLSMTFLNVLQKELKIEEIEEEDINKLFLNLYRLTPNIEKNILTIYNTILKIGEKLEINKEEIIESVLNKIEINKIRLQSEY